MISPIEKCLQTLRVLAAEGGINCISLAERAIDDFLASPSNEGQNRQTGAIHVLQESLTPIWREASGSRLEFINAIYAYIDRRFSALTLDA
jgi:hypothetical protein